MENDDRPVGRILTRREALVVLATSGYAMLGRYAPLSGQAGAAPAPCVVRPAQTEGPYFVDEMLHRADLRSDPSDGSVRPGTPLALTLVVSRLAGNACQPMSGVHVDLWQCDHEGIYSDVQDPGFNTKGKQFLRGYQLTDAQGKATFQTIYPGWYRGRTVHIHFKLRTTPRAASGHEFTSQLYFDDALTDRVFQAAPYAARGPRSTRNNADGIFRQNGAHLIVDLTPSGPGYAGIFQVAFQGV
jgi:protocatechuate 3,4-dioxygenase beta subunit